MRCRADNGTSLMVDSPVLRERMLAQPDNRECAGDQADQVTQELKVLARILIDAMKQHVERNGLN